MNTTQLQVIIAREQASLKERKRKWKALPELVLHTLRDRFLAPFISAYLCSPCTWTKLARMGPYGLKAQCNQPLIDNQPLIEVLCKSE